MIASKKEFQKKCKAEKAQCYLLTLVGTIIALIGLAIVLGILILEMNANVLPFPVQIIGYWFGAAVAVVGAALDITGEIKFRRAFKEQLQMKD